MADGHGRRRFVGRTRLGRERARVKRSGRRRPRGSEIAQAQARHAHVHIPARRAPHIPRRARVQRRRRRKEVHVHRRSASIPDVRREMVIRKRVLRQPAPCRPPRHPLEPVLVPIPVRLRTALRHLDVVLLRLGRYVRPIVVLEKVAMDVAQVDELDVGRVCAKVESCDFDGPDKGRSLGVGELSVEDVDERPRERRVEFGPFQVDRHRWQCASRDVTLIDYSK